jgi:hypothetical protein
MNNQTNIKLPTFDRSCHARIERINSEMTFGVTAGQMKFLKDLEAKYYIRINYDNIKTMVQASAKIKEILTAIYTGRVKLRPKDCPVIRVTEVK